MLVAHERSLGGVAELLPRVGTDGLQQRVASLAALFLDLHQRLVNEARQQVEDLGDLQATAGANRLNPIERPAPGEDRNAPEERLLGRAEQVVAPVDRRLKGALPGHRRA